MFLCFFPMLCFIHAGKIPACLTRDTQILQPAVIFKNTWIPKGNGWKGEDSSRVSSFPLQLIVQSTPFFCKTVMLCLLLALYLEFCVSGSEETDTDFSDAGICVDISYHRPRQGAFPPRLQHRTFYIFLLLTIHFCLIFSLFSFILALKISTCFSFLYHSSYHFIS